MNHTFSVLLFFASGMLPGLARAQAAPDVSFSTVNELVELYRDGQYEVVKAKLLNQGFRQVSVEPDYELHGTSHKGTFKMQYERTSANPQLRELGLPEVSEWNFSTETQGGRKTVEIFFELYTLTAAYTYQSLASVWAEPSLEQHHDGCNTDETCTQLVGTRKDAPVGYQGYCRLYLGYTLTKGSTGMMANYGSLRGNLTYNQLKKDPVKKVVQPVSKKRRV